MNTSEHDLTLHSTNPFDDSILHSSSEDLKLVGTNEFQMEELSKNNNNVANLSNLDSDTTVLPEKNIIVRDSKFWLIFLSLCVCSFLSALDLTAVSTVLPEMANEFQSNQYSYVGSAYALTSCAVSSLSLPNLKERKKKT